MYLPVDGAAPVFRHVPEPTGAELQGLVEQIAGRIGGLLERRGIVERDIENAWLAGDGKAGPRDDLIGHSSFGVIAALRVPAGSRCMPASTLRPAKGRSSNDCAAT